MKGWVDGSFGGLLSLKEVSSQELAAAMTRGQVATPARRHSHFWR